MRLVHLIRSWNCPIKLSDYNKLSDYIVDYNFIIIFIIVVYIFICYNLLITYLHLLSKLEENTEVYGPIIFEEIIIAMIMNITFVMMYLVSEWLSKLINKN